MLRLVPLAQYPRKGGKQGCCEDKKVNAPNQTKARKKKDGSEKELPFHVTLVKVSQRKTRNLATTHAMIDRVERLAGTSASFPSRSDFFFSVFLFLRSLSSLDKLNLLALDGTATCG